MTVFRQENCQKYQIAPLCRVWCEVGVGVAVGFRIGVGVVTTVEADIYDNAGVDHFVFTPRLDVLVQIICCLFICPRCVI